MIVPASAKHVQSPHVQITVVVAAGNAKTDSCTIAPGNVNGTLNMAASDLSTKFYPHPPDGVADGGACLSAEALSDPHHDLLKALPRTVLVQSREPVQLLTAV